MHTQFLIVIGFARLTVILRKESQQGGVKPSSRRLYERSVPLRAFRSHLSPDRLAE